jgi:phage shock protein PspC (stress-responsive transcriptional regulator)
MEKRLYRSEQNKIVAGICGGLGEYFDTDPTWIRIVMALAILVTGVLPGLVVYCAGIFIIPKQAGKPTVPRQLFRSTRDKMWGGICGGLAEYFNADSAVVRLVVVILTVFTGILPGLLIYLIALWIIPKAA